MHIQKTLILSKFNNEMTIMRPKLFLICAMTLLGGCGDDEVINQQPVLKIDYLDMLDRVLLSGTGTTDADNDPLTFSWTASDNITVIDNTKSGAFLMLPPGLNEKKISISMTVSDGKSSQTLTETITVPGLNKAREYGLGKEVGAQLSIDRGYDWYLDQGNSGTYSGVNCGPASSTMSIKWFNQNFSGTPEAARNIYRPEGGWWFTSDIINYLGKSGVSNYVVPLDKIDVLKETLDKGDIIILCLDMYQVKYNSGQTEQRVDKFYQTLQPGWGHFIVVKGYKIVDGATMYEVYDPYSFSQRYQDGSIKGKNRYYRSSDLDMATQIWWDFAIVITTTPQSNGRRGVDPATIVHKAGR